MQDPERTVRERLLDAHAETLAATAAACREVAAAWDDDVVADSALVTEPLEALLRERGLAVALLDLLTTGAAALDSSIRGDPVAAPPYLAITGRGPVLRATLADGRRLVVTVELFAIERRPTRYRFRDPEPADGLSAALRGGA